MAITKLKSNIINWWKEGKVAVNALIDGANGTDLSVINAQLSALPTANPGPGKFYLNAGVVTAGS